MTVLGRPPGVCCNCFSRDTVRTWLGTFYCAVHLAEARAFSEALRVKDGAALEVRV